MSSSVAHGTHLKLDYFLLWGEGGLSMVEEGEEGEGFIVLTTMTGISKGGGC